MIDYLIIGQGIAGTLMSYLLMKSGKSVFVLDSPDPRSASKVAGAVINPVAIHKWMAVDAQEVYIPVALSVYRDLEKVLQKSVISTIPAYVFHENAEVAEEIPGIRSNDLFGRADIAGVKWLSKYFLFEKLPTKIYKTWLVDADGLLQGWRNHLVTNLALIEQNLSFDEIQISHNQISYEGLHARNIIFCEGVSGRSNPFFPLVPFNRNRGDVLLLDIPGLPENAIYHSGLRLVPKGNHLFWYGSNYQWEYTSLAPDQHWREQALRHLNEWLKLPYTVMDHLVAERPTTAGQIPVVKFHPEYSNMIMFNGLGTKGFSYGPALAQKLCMQLVGE